MAKKQDRRLDTESNAEPRMRIGALLGKLPVPTQTGAALDKADAAAPQGDKVPRHGGQRQAHAAKSAAPTPPQSGGPIIEIWISKQGRAGKSVSLLKSSLAPPQAEALLAQLKRKLAVGGAWKDGEILLQTEDRPRVAQALLEKGYRSKICGG